MERTKHSRIVETGSVATGLALALFTGRGLIAPTAAAPVAIRIDGARPLQQIDGFGASLVAGFEAFERGHFDDVVPAGVAYRMTTAQRQRILKTAIRELGATHLRLWLYPPGIEPRNDNDDPRVMDWKAFQWKGESGKPQAANMVENRGNGIHEWGEFLKSAASLGRVDWILTPGDFPAWLHRRLDDPQDADRFEECAEWAAAHLLYLKRTFGIEARYWSLCNEPDVFGWKSPAFYAAWVKATGARFRKEGLATKIMFPDFMDVYAAVPLTAEVLKDAEARRYIGALAYHHYRSSGDGPQPFLEAVSKPETADAGPLFEKLTGGARAMAELGRRYGLPSWQTETGYYPRNTKGLSEWEIGRGRANEIYYELTSGASAVQGMCLFWPDAVDVRYDTRTRSEGHHILLSTDGAKLTRWEVSKDAGAVFAHYGRFVRPGDRRLGAECDDTSLRLTAFVSAQSRRYVAVVVNNSKDEKSVRFSLDHPRWKPRYASGLVTDATRTLQPHPITAVAGASGRYETRLPALSLTTFVWSETAPPRLALPEGTPKR